MTHQGFGMNYGINCFVRGVLAWGDVMREVTKVAVSSIILAHGGVVWWMVDDEWMWVDDKNLFLLFFFFFLRWNGDASNMDEENEQKKVTVVVVAVVAAAVHQRRIQTVLSQLKASLDEERLGALMEPSSSLPECAQHRPDRECYWRLHWSALQEKYEEPSRVHRCHGQSGIRCTMQDCLSVF